MNNATLLAEEIMSYAISTFKRINAGFVTLIEKGNVDAMALRQAAEHVHKRSTTCFRRRLAYSRPSAPVNP
ncbi:MAG: hypothetical protein JWM30_4 [Burkholderia sp.]|nr:hypothetical protein [Burkholderia sp.]